MVKGGHVTIISGQLYEKIVLLKVRNEMVTCPACEGRWEIGVQDKNENCLFCLGAKEVNLLRWIKYKFWSMMPDWIWDVCYKICSTMACGTKSEE